jgi:glucose/arabinose dehydrogenase
MTTEETPRSWDTEPTPLQLALARGHRWLAMPESGEVSSMKAIARREGVDDSYTGPARTPGRGCNDNFPALGGRWRSRRARSCVARCGSRFRAVPRNQRFMSVLEVHAAFHLLALNRDSRQGTGMRTLMQSRRLGGAACIACLLALLGSGVATGLGYRQQQVTLGDGVIRQATVPAGYVLEFLTELDGPRLPAFAGNGDLLIGSTSGKVYRLAPPYTRPEVLVTLDGYPHSVALREGELLIARTDGLYRAPYRPGQTAIDPRAVSLLAALPGGGGHSSRTVRIGPEERVYVSLGISGNCSDQYLGAPYRFEDRRGGVLVLVEEGARPHFEPYASGLRNPVGFDWQPGTGVMYASNNGPDHLGYDQPPEYFSRLDPGSFHGMPWFQYDGRRLRRDACIKSPPPRSERDVVLPVATFPARNAPLGVTFVPPGALDPEFTGDAIVALHGSWATWPSGSAFGNPATRRPPALVRVRFRNGVAQGVEALVSGFQLDNGERWARPVGVAFGPDGALYFTSDGGDTQGLFRVRRESPAVESR